MRMFKGPAGSGADDWHFPQALAFATSGIRSSDIVSITCDNEIITGKYLFVLILSLHTSNLIYQVKCFLSCD